MDKATGEVLLDDNGAVITAQTVFTPAEKDGSVDVEFNFSGVSVAGKTTVVFESLEYNGAEVAVHDDITDEGQTIRFSEIHTTATNEETGTHTAYPSTSVTIVDAVSYSNLLVGKEYTITGTLVNKKTGEPILDNGKEVTAEKTFVAEKESGTEDLTFTFNASALAGESIVAFETFSYKGKEVASHTDLNDEDQTIHFPSIGTTAKFSTGTKTTKKSGKITIVDTVAYQNLVPGETYIIRGTLMDKTTGEVFQIDGVEVTAEKTFVAEKESGTEDLTFTFDAESFSNNDLVVFEEVYTKDTNTLVAEHKDINDIGQTVSLDDVPKTGDTFPVIPICAAAFLALVGITVVFFKKRKN
jgi:hypothetical protein